MKTKILFGLVLSMLLVISTATAMTALVETDHTNPASDSKRTFYVGQPFTVTGFAAGAEGVDRITVKESYNDGPLSLIINHDCKDMTSCYTSGKSFVKNQPGKYKYYEQAYFNDVQGTVVVDWLTVYIVERQSDCGNTQKEEGEDCDYGKNVNGVKPTNIPYDQDQQYCGADCKWATAYGPYCGDNAVQTQYEQCEQNSDCNAECMGSIYYPGNNCVKCQCVSQGTDCDLKDGHYATDEYKWVTDPSNECKQKQQ
ncbi:hypothetical protein JXA85_04185, partial [Candidatus Woesearchaeota archaeon]|nr:hypothetical protein [Candidatus Woesearchaeota archaeon]